MNYGTYGGPGRPGGRPSSTGFVEYTSSHHGNHPRRTSYSHERANVGSYGGALAAPRMGNVRTGAAASRGARAGVRRPRPSPELSWSSRHGPHQRDPPVYVGPPRFDTGPVSRCRRHSCNGALRPMAHHQSPPHRAGSSQAGYTRGLVSHSGSTAAHNNTAGSSGLGFQNTVLGSHSGSLGSQSSGSSSGYSGGTDEVTSSESELPSSSELGDPSSGGDPADVELSQAIPRIIKPRKRRKKEKRPKIPRMAAAEEQRRAAERRPSSLGSSSSAESAASSGGWCLGADALSQEQLELLCHELSTLRMRRHLTPPGDLLTPEMMTPPASPGAVGCLRRSRSDPNHHHRSGGGEAEEFRGLSCPSSLEFRDSIVNTAQPPQRTWHPLGRPCSTQSTCIFTVMCYNVLCEKYATRQMYGYCPNWALEWDYRKKIIMQEIRNYSADIITLQEVQTDQFYNFFLPTLQRDKYEGIFSPKSRAKTMAESERKFVDGCAIFWRTEKFTLVKDYLVEFNQLAMANAEGSDDMLNRVMTKDNIGLAAMLETREAAWESGPEPMAARPSQRLLVCTAHIHWDPEFCDVKLIQTMMLMHEIKQIIDQASREPPSFRPGGLRSSTGGNNSIQLLLCGDLNSLPDSGVVEFLVNGRIPANHTDFKELGYRTCLKKLSSNERNTTEYSHPFRLASSYSPDIMPYTNYTYDFKGIIDYIFYNRDTMTPLGVLGPLDPDWLRENKVQGCPHPHVPSDHFSLLVELEMSASRADPVTSTNGLIAHR